MPKAPSGRFRSSSGSKRRKLSFANDDYRIAPIQLEAGAFCHPIGNPGSFPSLSRAEQCKLSSRECAEQARLVADVRAKKVFEDLAQQWLELAAQIELQERTAERI